MSERYEAGSETGVPAVADGHLRDPLTGLLNRAAFVDHTRRALERARRSDCLTAMFCIDVDRFRLVNERLGHAAGDQLLAGIGQRLSSIVRAYDAVTTLRAARLGGDEFWLVCDDVGDPTVATGIAARISEALGGPFIVGASEVAVTVSLGIALAPPALDAEQLTLQSEAGLRGAKERGGERIEFFDPSLTERARGLAEMEAALRAGIEQAELRLHYQPKIALDSDRIIGVEALVRWEHPERGLIPPGDFIPLAEQTGLIRPMGAWVVAEACRQAAIWAGRFPDLPPLTVAVNVSARQFDSSLVATVRDALAAADADASTLCIEVTESMVMHDYESAISTLRELKSLGVTVSVDDFGTGYSSLAYLRRLPLDELKVDKSFVDGLGIDPEDTAIVAAVIAMAQALDLAVVAEGVETPGQLATLRSLGCEFAQGYYFARPQPVAAIDQLLAAAGSARRLSSPSLADGTPGSGAAAAAEVVVVADDAADVRALARVSLSAAGFTVQEAPDGAEALAVVRHIRPACLVLDVSLPDMTGFEICRAVRADPATAGCTIVMLTARADAGDKVEAFSAGADDYMVKPFAPRDLIARVRAALRRRSEAVRPMGQSS